MLAFLKRRWALLYLAGVGALATLSAVDPSGLAKHRRLATEVGRVVRENQELQQENLRLRREARALAGDPPALERAAREELGYVRPGEVIYQLTPREGPRP
jgi:cell division protein FtsB